MKKQTFKKLSAILAVAMIIAAIAPLSAQAAYGDKFTVDNIEYFVAEDASGSNPGKAWVFNYNASFGNVDIPATATNALNSNKYTVTRIFQKAFENKLITNVTIPSTVEDISTSAFYFCASLTNVSFEPGSKLATLGDAAFRGCESLVSINLPDGLETISATVFSYCTSLESIKLPGGLKTIDDEAFNYCSSLKSIDIPASVNNIGKRAFGNCSSLKTINIPASVNNIGELAFYNCSNLNEIIFNSPTAPNVTGSIFDRVAPTGKIYYPKNGVGYDDAFFNNLFDGPFPTGWRVDKPSAPSVFEPVNESAEVPEADVPGFGRTYSVSGEVTNAPGVPESVVLNVSTPSPEFTSNKAANAAYSDALLHGQPVAFNALEVVDAASGGVFALPKGAEVKLKFELGKAYADKAITISQYDAAGELIERFNVTCDGDGLAVINASGLGLFVITREWLG